MGSWCNLLIGNIYPELKELTTERYQLTFQQIARRLLDVNGVLQVYRMGSWSYIGTSDIDFVIVVDSHSIEIKKIMSVFESLDGLERYIAYQHPPMVLNESLFKWIDYIRPVGRLFSHVGETVLPLYKIDERSQEHALVEIILYYYPSVWLELIKKLRYRELDIIRSNKLKFVEYLRISLQLMHAVRFVADLWKELDMGFDEKAYYFLKSYLLPKVSELRRGFISSDLFDLWGNIVSLIVKFLYLTSYITYRVYSYIVEKYQSYLDKKAVVWLLKNKVFLSDLNVSGWIKLPLPYSEKFVLLYPYSLYSFWKKHIVRRKYIMSSYCSWVSKCNYWAMYCPYLYYSPPLFRWEGIWKICKLSRQLN